MNESAESWFDDLNMDVDEALILRLLDEREEARSNKDFGKADQIRQKIESLGVSIEDGPNGPARRNARCRREVRRVALPC